MKKFISLLLSALLAATLFTSLPLTAGAAEVDSAKAGSPGGSFGTCSWTYDSDTHTLTVSGTGSTGDFSSSTAKPWADYADEVYDIVVTQGVTALGKHVFSNMKQADTVKLAPSVTAIGRNAFYKCTNLTDVTLPDTIESIGTAAFINTGLASITIPNPDCTIDSLSMGYSEGRNLQIFKKAGFTVYGYSDSTAQTYADSNGFSFIDLNSEPHYIYVHYGSAYNLSTGEGVVTEARAGERIHVAPDRMEKFTVFRSFTSEDVTLDETEWNFVMPDTSVNISMDFDRCYPLDIDLSDNSAVISEETYNYLVELIQNGQLNGQLKSGTEDQYIITFADEADILLTPTGVYTYDFDYAPSYSEEVSGNYIQNPVNFIFAENQIFQSHVDLTLPAVGSAWDYYTMHAELAPTNDAWNLHRFTVSDGVWYNHWGISLFDTFEGGEEYFVGFNLVPNSNYYFTLTSEVVINIQGTDRSIYLKPLYMNADGSVYYSNGYDQIRFVGGELHRVTVCEGYASVDGETVTQAVPGQRVTVRLLKEAIGDNLYVVMGSDSATSSDVEVTSSESIGSFFFYMPNHDVTVSFTYETDWQTDLVWDLYNGPVTVSDDHTQRSIANGAQNVLRRMAANIGYSDDATYYDIDGDGSYDIQMQNRNVFSLTATNSLKENIKLEPDGQQTLYYPVRSIKLQVKQPVKHKITVTGGVATSKHGDFANNYVITEAAEGDLVFVYPRVSDLGDDYYIAQFSAAATSDDAHIFDDAMVNFVMPDKDVTVNYTYDRCLQDTGIMDFRYDDTVTFESDGTGPRSESYGVFMVMNLLAKNEERVSDDVTNYDLDGDGGMDISLDSSTDTYTLLPTNSLPIGSLTLTLSREQSWTPPIRSVVIMSPNQPEPPKRGDVNFDGKVTIEDATIIQRHLAEFLNENNGPLIDESDPEWLYRADANNDGKLNVRDVTAIQRFLAGTEELMP